MPWTRRRKLAAWGVHAYTALGLPLALISTVALFRGDVELFWALNGIAVLVDATDGMLARAVKVKDVLPQFSGRRLDDLVDFITFAFLPALALVQLGMLPENLPYLAIVPLLASGYGFCQERAKTDESFVGFPSYWNFGVLYLFLLGTRPWVNAITIVVFSILVFVPIHYVYPTRTPMLKRLTLGTGAVWSLVMFVLVLNPMESWARDVALVSTIYPLYYFVISAVHHRRVSHG